MVINGVHSQWGNIEAGVPQGSVLGPLLFLIFMNDITFVTQFCKIRLFADDTCLFIEVDNPDLGTQQLNTDLESINDWAKKWLVTFSPPKTEEMIISNKKNQNYPPLQLNNHTIKTVRDHKHLGITFSKDLSWKVHIQEIAKKANRRLGILQPLKYKLDRKSLEVLYKSFVRPLLEYGDVIWHIPDPHNHLLNTLDKVHKTAAKLITGATTRCQTTDLLKEAGWESLAERRIQHRVALMFNITTGTAPPYLQDIAPTTVQQRTTYNLRNRGDLDQPMARLVPFANSFFPATTKLWNTMPDAIKNSTSPDSFKYNYLKTYPRPPRNELYYLGTRKESICHAKLRIGCSPLNSHLHNYLHVIDSPKCICPLGLDETTEHFLLHCPIYMTQRQDMFNALAGLGIVMIDEDLLLYGNPDLDLPTNHLIFQIVQTYITQTSRLF